MLSVIRPEQFKTTLWKNCKGQTTELAINPGGQLDDFEWRISIADMSENGRFSKFNGYRRHLLLLSGVGLALSHDTGADVLLKPMEVTSFDGANQTTGELINGPVKNFNVMTKHTVCSAVVSFHQRDECFDVLKGECLFVFAPQGHLTINADNKVFKVGEGCLASISKCCQCVKISGSTYILIRITGFKDKNN